MISKIFHFVISKMSHEILMSQKCFFVYFLVLCVSHTQKVKMVKYGILFVTQRTLIYQWFKFSRFIILSNGNFNDICLFFILLFFLFVFFLKNVFIKIYHHLLQKFKYCDSVLSKLSCLLLEDDEICYHSQYNFLVSRYYLQ